MAGRSSAADAGRAVRRSAPRAAALALSTVIIAGVAVSLLVWVARGMTAMPISFGSTPVGVLGLVISPICYAAVGGIVASRLPRNPTGWLFLLIAAALGIMLPVNLLVAASHEALLPASSTVVWVAWARTTVGTPTVLTAAILAVLLFPDGRWPARGWRWVGAWAVAMGLLLLATTAVDPVGLVTYPSLSNPLALPYESRPIVDGVRGVAVGGIVLSALAAVVAIRQRHRTADARGRAQLRWIVVAVVVCVAAAVPFVVARYVLHVSEATGELLAAAAQIGACAFPLAAAMAMSRHRLFDIDALIGRTLVYLPLMAVMGGMYTAGIALFQRIFVAVTGSESEAAVVLAILVVASAFTPVRRALEATIDRRFAASSSAAAAEHHPGQKLADLRVVQPDGTVDCPYGVGRSIQECLRCPRLLAVTSDGAAPTIACRRTTS